MLFHLVDVASSKNHANAVVYKIIAKLQRDIKLLDSIGFENLKWIT
jgi:hypothetical protein